MKLRLFTLAACVGLATADANAQQPIEGYPRAAYQPQYTQPAAVPAHLLMAQIEQQRQLIAGYQRQLNEVQDYLLEKDRSATHFDKATILQLLQDAQSKQDVLMQILLTMIQNQSRPQGNQAVGNPIIDQIRSVDTSSRNRINGFRGGPRSSTLPSTLMPPYRR